VLQVSWFSGVTQSSFLFTAVLTFRVPFLAPMNATTVPVTFIEPDGTEREVQAEVGKHLLDAAHDNNVELEGR